MKFTNLLGQIVCFMLFAVLFIIACSDDTTTGPDTGEPGVTEYTITATAQDGGSISPSGDVTVEEGDNQQFEITANSGYVIQDVLVDGNSEGAIESYTFENVQGNHSIEALFEEEPDLPETTPVEVDVSYFEEADAGNTEEYQTFNMASSLAGSANGILQGYMNFAGFYFEMGENEEAVIEDGVWIWEYTYDTITIKITAEDTGTGTEWNLYIDGTDPDTGEIWDNHRLMYGFIAHDNSYGEWAYYSADDTVTDPVLYYEWEFNSEDDYWMELTITDEESGEIGQLTYTKDGVNNTIESADLYAEGGLILYWNTDTNTGYIQEDGERVCWDDNYVTTSCSELGY